jgi:DNA repair exonuclease SbcCD ATPase subunit
VRLEELEVVNFCQHRHATFRFQEGLNAIIGPNGSGKSNLLKAAYAAPTGDFSRNEGKNTDNICDLAPEGSPSHVLLRFTHGGRSAVAKRGLNPVGRSFQIGNGPIITGDREMSKAVYDMLDVSPEILAEYVFVDQWQVFSVFALSPAKRAAAFQRLFRIEKVQSLWEDLGKAAAGVKIPVVQVDKDEIGRRLDGYQAELDGITGRLQAMATPQDVRSDLNAAQNVVTAWNRRAQIEKRAAGRRQMMERTATELLEVEVQAATTEVDLTTLRTARDTGAVTVQGAADVMARWREYHRHHYQRVELQKLDAQLRAEWAGRGTPPTAPDGYWPEWEKSLAANLSELYATRLRKDEFVRKFDPTCGVAECPECGQPTASLADRVLTTRDELERLAPAISDLETRTAAYKRHERAVLDYSSWKSGYDWRYRQLETQRQALGQVQPPPVDEETTRKALNDHQEVVDAVSAMEKEHAELVVKLTRLRERHAAEEREYQRDTDELATLPASSAVAEKARLAVEELQQLERTRAELEGRSDGLSKAVYELEAEIARLHALQVEADVAVEWRAHLEQMREVLHYTALPRLVSLHHLDKLSADVNSYLRLFDSPFRVEVDESLGFTCIFHQGGKRRPAGRLSGGQKVVLALAFRLSVNNAFASDLGLLCLDEPTVGLDEHNLGSLEIALGRLRELAKSTGLQVVMVTHERSLAPLFDNVISLYQPG